MTHDEDDGLVFHDNLHCLVQRLEYDFARRAGVLIGEKWQARAGSVVRE